MNDITAVYKFNKVSIVFNLSIGSETYTPYTIISSIKQNNVTYILRIVYGVIEKLMLYEIGISILFSLFL